ADRVHGHRHRGHPDDARGNGLCARAPAEDDLQQRLRYRMRVRPYLFYDVGISICAACFRRVDAKIVFEGDRVLMIKRCPEHVARMLDAVVRNEGQPDVVQISGGEPTIHPDLFAVLDLAKARPIRHLMVNTNGVKIAESEAFAARLAGYMPDFEVYLQFDSFE